MERTLVEVYCDGGYRAKSKLGGYGVVIFEGLDTREHCGVAYNTTNNRMELIACLKALTNLNSYTAPTTIYSDSAYVVNGVNEWSHNWIQNGWVTQKGDPVVNQDLWKPLLELYRRFDDITITHCLRSSLPGNIRADELVNYAMDSHLENRKDA